MGVPMTAALTLDPKGYLAGLNKVQGATARVARDASRAFQIAAGVLTGLPGMITVAFAGVSLAKAVSEANEATRIARQFEILFGEAAQAGNQWADEFSSSIQRTKSEVMGWANQFQMALTGMDMARGKAAEFSQALTETAARMARFTGATEEAAVSALQSAMLGNTRGLRDFRISLSESDVAAQAFRMGIAGVGDELTDQQRAVATYQAVVERLDKAIGEAGPSLSDFEQSQRSLGSAIKELTESLGLYITRNETAMDVIDSLAAIVRVATEELDDNRAATNAAVEATTSGMDLAVGGVRLLQAALSLLKIAWYGLKAFVLDWAAIVTGTTGAIIRGFEAIYHTAAKVIARLKGDMNSYREHQEALLGPMTNRFIEFAVARQKEAYTAAHEVTRQGMKFWDAIWGEESDFLKRVKAARAAAAAERVKSQRRAYDWSKWRGQDETRFSIEQWKSQTAAYVDELDKRYKQHAEFSEQLKKLEQERTEQAQSFAQKQFEFALKGRGPAEQVKALYAAARAQQGAAGKALAGGAFEDARKLYEQAQEYMMRAAEAARGLKAEDIRGRPRRRVGGLLMARGRRLEPETSELEEALYRAGEGAPGRRVGGLLMARGRRIRPDTRSAAEVLMGGAEEMQRRIQDTFARQKAQIEQQQAAALANITDLRVKIDQLKFQAASVELKLETKGAGKQIEELRKAIEDLDGKVVTIITRHVEGFQGGGWVGRRGTDTVPAMLTPGEYVLTPDDARQFVPLLRAMKSGAFPARGFARGGPVTNNYGPVNIQMPAGSDRQYVRTVVIPEIERARARGRI
jgi:hypothetical protein